MWELIVTKSRIVHKLVNHAFVDYVARLIQSMEQHFNSEDGSSSRDLVASPLIHLHDGREVMISCVCPCMKTWMIQAWISRNLSCRPETGL